MECRASEPIVSSALIHNDIGIPCFIVLHLTFTDFIALFTE